jgi:hypothetical protein
MCLSVCLSVCVYVRRAFPKNGDFAYKGLKCRWLRALSVSRRVSKVFAKSRKALILKGLRVSRFVSRVLLTGLSARADRQAGRQAYTHAITHNVAENLRKCPAFRFFAAYFAFSPVRRLLYCFGKNKRFKRKFGAFAVLLTLPDRQQAM